MGGNGAVTGNTRMLLVGIAVELSLGNGFFLPLSLSLVMSNSPNQISTAPLPSSPRRPGCFETGRECREGKVEAESDVK